MAKSETKYAALVVATVLAMLLLSLAPQFGATSAGASDSSQTSATETSTYTEPSPAVTQSQVAVGIGGHEAAAFFNPATVRVQIGVNNTVVWSNGDTAIHTVTSTNLTSSGALLFNSGDLSLGGVFSYTFTQPGTYSYICIYHGEMVGRVIVVGPTGG